MRKKIQRRDVLLGASATGASIVLGGAGYTLGNIQHSSTQPQVQNNLVPFYGRYQAGIATPAQNHLHFAAFDLITEQYTDVRSLLQIWTEAAAVMSTGHPIGEGNFPAHEPPPDTGEAIDNDASRLTITFGFGPTLFELHGKNRYGLAAQRPQALVDIPPMKGDALQTERSGGDLCVQACSDNPQVAFHAIRNLARLARGIAVMRWSQLGFDRTASTSQFQQTPRNLMGFKDGTNNLKIEDTALLNQHVWVPATDEPTWMHDGTYLVTRRIRMNLEAWDRDFLGDQENVIGRHKVSGAPLGKQHEFDMLEPATLPNTAHVRLAHGDGTLKILRRGYSFTDGMDNQTGELDAGLFFIAFQRDPRTQFIPLQTNLANNDGLNEYITHVGSAIFACPPGVQDGGFIGETLFTTQ